MIYVSCTHRDARWRLDRQPFAVQEAGEYTPREYRIGGDHANGYYAVAPHFGCGKNRSTPKNAIIHLLTDNGAQNITFHSSDPQEL